MGNLKNLNALIVEDDPIILELIAEDFSDAGAQIETAICGIDAVHLIQKIKFDFVLSDMRMQNGDGKYVAEEIQKLKGHKPALFIYSGANDLTKENLTELGIKAIFSKPVKTKILIEQILIALEKTQ